MLSQLAVKSYHNTEHMTGTYPKERKYKLNFVSGLQGIPESKQNKRD